MSRTHFSVSALLGACLFALAATAPAHAASRSSGATAGVAPGAGESTALDLVPAFIDVNLAGFQTYGDFGDPANSQVFLTIPAGSVVNSWDFLNLRFTTSGESYLNEFVLSVNNSAGSEYLDGAPSNASAGGVFGPASGSWATAAGGSGGDPFAVADGRVWVTVYELFVDDGLNATVNAGTLRIYYDSPVPVPEPATYGLMAMGLLGVGAVARRRISNSSSS